MQLLSQLLAFAEQITQQRNALAELVCSRMPHQCEYRSIYFRLKT